MDYRDNLMRVHILTWIRLTHVINIIDGTEMSMTVLCKFYHIYISILESTRSDRDRWSQFAINGKKMSLTVFIYFSNHDTSNIPNLSDPTINSSLAPKLNVTTYFQIQSQNIYSHISQVRTWFIYCFFSYVVIIHLFRRG